MFKQLSYILKKGEKVQIVVTKNEENLTMSVVPVYKNDEVGTLPPVSATGTAEFLDEKLIPEFGPALEVVREGVINISSLAEAIKKQHVLVNSFVADIASTLLWDLLTKKKIDSIGAFFNLETMRVVKVPAGYYVKQQSKAA